VKQAISGKYCCRGRDAGRRISPQQSLPNAEGVNYPNACSLELALLIKVIEGQYRILMISGGKFQSAHSLEGITKPSQLLHHQKTERTINWR
jgi:hypothetical protein